MRIQLVQILHKLQIMEKHINTSFIRLLRLLLWGIEPIQKEQRSFYQKITDIYATVVDYATRQARRQIPMTMEDWKTKLDAFLRFNDAEVLENKGKVTAAIAKEFAESEFEKYRVLQDALYQSDFDKLVKASDV